MDDDDWISCRDTWMAFNDVMSHPASTVAICEHAALPGILDSRARLIDCGGEIRNDADLHPDFWKGLIKTASAQNWAIGSLRWDAGRVKWSAVGVEFRRNHVAKIVGMESLDRIIPNRSDGGLPAGETIVITPAGLASLPPELSDRAHTLSGRAARAEWWDWFEALAWVRTRDIEELGAQAALREAWKTEGHSLSDNYLTLRGLNCGVAEVEEELLAALCASGSNRVVAVGTNQSGEEIEIQTSAWRDGRVAARGSSVYLRKSSEPLGMLFSDLLFRREDLMRVFLAEDGSERPKSGAPGRPTSMHVATKLLAKGIADGSIERRIRSGEIDLTGIAVADAIAADLVEELGSHEKYAGLPEISGKTILNKHSSLIRSALIIPLRKSL